jgi:hypothetical protein
MHIFISFSSVDREVARRIEAALALRMPGVSFFLDEKGLTGGAYWTRRLGEEIERADVVLLLVGHRVGPWQQLEYDEALRLSRLTERGDRPRVIPVVMVDYAPGLPFLSTLHQIFTREPTSAESLIAIERALQEAGAGEPPVEAWRRFQPYKGIKLNCTIEPVGNPRKHCSECACPALRRMLPSGVRELDRQVMRCAENDDRVGKGDGDSPFSLPDLNLRAFEARGNGSEVFELVEGALDEVSHRDLHDAACTQRPRRSQTFDSRPSTVRNVLP